MDRSLQAIRNRLRVNSTNSNKLDRLREIRTKELRSYADREGLNEHSTINWERPELINTDFKADEKNLQHDFTSIMKQGTAMNERQSIIDNIIDDDQTVIVNDQSHSNHTQTQTTDQKHFDAIFSKPIAGDHREIKLQSSKGGTKRATDTDVSERIVRKEKNRNASTFKKRKVSWRKRVSKYKSM